MKILFIHGANSTYRSFSYFAARMSAHDITYFEYDTRTPLSANILRAQLIVDADQPDAIIAHSLGGIITAHLRTTAKKVTLATPFGGSAIANLFPMFSQLMRDIMTTSPLISALRDMTFEEDFLAIVANGITGNGFDGIVTARSQTQLRGADYRIYDLNHFEILCDGEIFDAIMLWLQ